jgi:hypothetical protein
MAEMTYPHFESFEFDGFALGVALAAFSLR